jgi:hypothetical protein
VVERFAARRDPAPSSVLIAALDRLKPPDRGAHWRATGAQRARGRNLLAVRSACLEPHSEVDSEPSRQSQKIRLETIPSELEHWLESSADDVTADGYQHHVLTEGIPRDQALDALTRFVRHTHQDVVEHINRVAGISLSPTALNGVEGSRIPPPTDGYPELLPRTVLMGYFGEIVAGFVAQTSTLHSLTGWRVPAYLFRFHEQAFELLERVRQGASVPRAIPGRTGDDCLAFLRDASGNVTHALVCEAKCYARHDEDAVSAAHEKVSGPELVPVSVMAVITVLRDYDDAESQDWADALARLRLSPSLDFKRFDMVSYVCGQRARVGHGYMACDTPHDSYSGGRGLASVDVHLPDVWSLVATVYGVTEG